MLFHIGIMVVLLSLIVGFIGTGGNVLILFQPFEILIITGTAIGSYMLSNPSSLLKNVFQHLPKITRGTTHQRENYLELLVFLFSLFKFAKTHPIMELEFHIETPHKSHLFKKFSSILQNQVTLIFICDYMRMFILGFDNPYELEQMMDDDLNMRKMDAHDVSLSLQRLGDTLPALGILAAVLGVINAMASINAEPHILGAKIAGALIGTFLGIFFSYCIVMPVGVFLGKFLIDEVKFLECIKVAIISYAKGHPPTISVEFARQNIPQQFKPTFEELESTIKKYIIKRQSHAF